MPNLPERVDRAALERILQRATELQASERDIGEGLTTDEVFSLGKDVGIPGRYLQQAMLEEQTRVVATVPAGVAGVLAGPGEVTAGRVMQGEVDAVEAALIDWMERNELLVVQRRQPGRITWERLTGMQAALRRGMSTFDGARPRFLLTKATLVSATVARLEPGYCHVQLTADLRRARGAVLGGGAAVASIGASGTLVLAVLGAFAPIVPIPFILALPAAWFTMRSHRSVAERAQLGLERLLDHLEQGGVKPSHQLPPGGIGLIGTIATEIRRALQPPSTPSTDRRTPP